MNEQSTTEAKRSHRGLRGEGDRFGEFTSVGAKWIASRPTESGDYWFRSTEHSVPQVVTLKGNRVTFRSGKTKKLVDVRGQWGGVVIPSTGPMSKYSRSQPKTETWSKLIGKLLVGAVIGALFYEPYFLYVADEKQPEMVLEIGPNQDRISITVFPVFRNIGLKPGQIENAEFSPREPHLDLENVKLNYCDKASIHCAQYSLGKRLHASLLQPLTVKHRRVRYGFRCPIMALGDTKSVRKLIVPSHGSSLRTDWAKIRWPALCPPTE